MKNNYSNYLNDVKFTYAKTKLSPEISYMKN